MPLTHQYVTERFFSLVEFLPENKKEIIKEYWGGKTPEIVTNPFYINNFEKKHNSGIDLAGTDGLTFLFRIHELEESDLDHVILHELAHAWLFAKYGTSIQDYKEDKGKMIADEMEAKLISKDWLSKLHEQP